MASWDILGFGIVAVDDLLIVKEYPPADRKIPVTASMRDGGGLTGTALVAASRLGAKCAYAGVLGHDKLSKWMLSKLKQENIDCERVIFKPGARPYHSIIIVDKTSHTRNIFFSGLGVTPHSINEINESLISETRVLFVDHHSVESMLQAVLIAKQLGIPTVADIESNEHPRIGELIIQIDHLILSLSFAREFTGEYDPLRAIQKLHHSTQRACTAITGGKDGCWYIEKGGSVRYHPAFQVKVVDTTGCGDVFHGAYAAGLASGCDVSYCIHLASATAAIKATKMGGQAGIPDRPTVIQFMIRRKSVHYPTS